MNPFRFSTQYTDDETDLVHYLYRVYNPSTGRWLSRDPIGEEGGLNLMAFVANDGVNQFDYLGLSGSMPATPELPVPHGGQSDLTTVTDLNADQNEGLSQEIRMVMRSALAVDRKSPLALPLQ